MSDLPLYTRIAMYLADRGCECHVLGECIPPGHEMRDPIDQPAANDAHYPAAC